MMKLGGLEIKDKAGDKPRITLLLWGLSSAGKTTFACSAPGEKLIINFDPDGYRSVMHRKDVHVLDAASLDLETFENKINQEHPLNLGTFLEENPQIETVIIDSLTTLQQSCLANAVRKKIGRSNQFTPSIETPGLSAYGARNAIMLRIVSNILRITGKLNRHVIAIAHEDAPHTDKDGAVMYITTHIADRIRDAMHVRFSEIWWLNKDHKDREGTKRTIAISPTLGHKPMKSRMFVSNDEPSFALVWNADKDKYQPLADWYTLWEKAGKKIPLPTQKKGE